MWRACNGSVERALADANIKVFQLGEVIQGIRPAQRGESQVGATFDLDAYGVLTDVAVRNSSDAVAYQAERQIRHLDDKIPANAKARAELLYAPALGVPVRTQPPS